ncbi:MAG: type II secretion system F family protein [Desulfuromonadales bacterium]
MDLTTVLLLFAVFLFTVSIVAFLFLAVTEGKFAEKRRIKKRLLFISAGGRHGQEKLSIYRKRVLKDASPFERFIYQMPRISRLDKMLIKARIPLNATTFLLASSALGAIGLLAGLKFLPRPSVAIALGLLLLFLPYFLLRIAEKAYYNKFQDQLPEALDLLARALRSGNALTAGLEMMAEEMQDPIGGEFGAVVDEIKLGLTLNEAFANLCERVPSTDLRFFTIAILLQKETGGNIAEILDNISNLIRQRIQFARQVKALTAEGRYSAGVLISLPVVMFLYMYFVRYEYISLLWNVDIGRYMIAGGIVSQILGALMIRKIVTVEI